jgi:DNA-binding LacI/PurR family transcriptional regulator
VGSPARKPHPEIVDVSIPTFARALVDREPARGYAEVVQGERGRGSARRPTLQDVADRAGVSRALASIIMRDAPGASDATRERVARVAAELGYRPDARARLLASGSSPLLGVVFNRTGTFHLELLDGIYASAEPAGYDVILSALTAHRDEHRAVETLLDFRCDAVILLGPDGARPVLAGRLPVVVVGWQVDDPSVDVIRTSDDLGSRLAIDHLVSLGHSRIAHVTGGRGSVSRARSRGYRAAMRHHGLRGHIEEVAGGIHEEEGIAAAHALLERGPLPTAIMAYNDDLAAGLSETLFRAGIRVPEDVSITGWNDSALSRLPHLNLTTVRQDADEMARMAVQRSIDRVTETPIAQREIVLPPQLRVRASTGTAPSQPR